MKSVREIFEEATRDIESSAQSLDRILVKVRRRRVRQRIAAGVVGLGFTAALGFFFLTLVGREEPRSTIHQPRPPEQGQGFFPAVYSEGELELMLVTFPDGRTAQLLYPPELRLSDMPMRPTGFFVPKKRQECGAIAYAHFGTEEFFHAGGSPLATFQRQQRAPAHLWEPLASATYPERWLVFRFGDWRVGIPVQRPCASEELLSTWANGLDGRQTEAGFLILEAGDQLRGFRPGDPDAPTLHFEGDAVSIELASRPCTPPSGEDVVTIDGRLVQRTGSTADVGALASWCLENDEILVRVEGEDSAVDAVVRGLEARIVSP